MWIPHGNFAFIFQRHNLCDKKAKSYIVFNRHYVLIAAIQTVRQVSLVFVNLMAFTLYICLIISIRRLHDYVVGSSVELPPLLRQPSCCDFQDGAIIETAVDNDVVVVVPPPYCTAADEHKRDVWIVRLLVQNGLAMFAVWGSVASMFNFAVVLTYRTGARQDVSSTVSLSIFAVEIIVWWTFENFVFEQHMRYLVTPYVVLVTSIAGIVWKNHSLNTSNEILVLALLLLVITLAGAKVALLVWRRRRRRRRSHRKQCEGDNRWRHFDPASVGFRHIAASSALQDHNDVEMAEMQQHRTLSMSSLGDAGRSLWQIRRTWRNANWSHTAWRYSMSTAPAQQQSIDRNLRVERFL